MEEKVTVLMSVYNDEKHIKESIESIINQTYKNFDFIIFDDASTDETASILKHYSLIDNRIQVVFNNVNKGLSKNLAKGMLKAKTDLVVRMDADDISYPQRIEILVRKMNEEPTIDICGSNAHEINEYGKITRLRKMPNTHEDIMNKLWSCPFIHPSTILRKESIIRIGNYDGELKRRQDYELWFRAAKHNLRFYNINESLLSYRIDQNTYYKKNGSDVNAVQLKIALQGIKDNHLGVKAYFAVVLNYLSHKLPQVVRIRVNEIKNLIRY